MLETNRSCEAGMKASQIQGFGEMYGNGVYNDFCGEVRSENSEGRSVQGATLNENKWRLAPHGVLSEGWWVHDAVTHICP